MTHDRARQFKPAAGIDDEMGPTSFFRIRHLSGKNGVELGFGHARSGQDARALDRFRRTHHDRQIDTRFPARLEQQGHIDDDEPPASSRRVLHELNARLRDCGMHKTFEALQRLRVTQHSRSKPLAVDAALRP